jgi:hypothetical protein
VVQPGYRSKTITTSTTLTDAQTHSKADTTQLDGFRWNSELDIRSIAKSCEMRNSLRNNTLDT